jgi:hypothetical protein
MKSFEAEEYDAGASTPHQASQRVEQKNSWTSQHQNFEFHLDICCAKH